MWVDSVGRSRNNKHHNLRVKATSNNVEVVAGFDNKGKFTTFETPKQNIRNFKQINKLKKYLVSIKPILELHWEKQLTDRELLNILAAYGDCGNLLDAIEQGIMMDEQKKRDTLIYVKIHIIS